ncbi:MAG: uroporphyrinogen-III synthase [Rhodospirillales bacterium]|nr:uroporphyrinogen-III synthase [Rhodospirillales bacterium]
MRLLITRPTEDAAPLVRALEECGHEAIVEALMTIHDVAAPDLNRDLDGAQALLITSANGIRAFARAHSGRLIPVCAVGDASARVARELGFHQVHSAGGDVETLAAMVEKKFKPSGGALVHIAGTHLAGDLGGKLTQAGFEVRRVVLYEARASNAIGPKTTAALKSGSLDGVLLFSPRTAELFYRLVTDAGLEEHCRQLTACCLSAAVAEKASALAWASVVVASTPDQQALLKAIETPHQQ